jgi:putative oxidoreductase
MRLWPRLEKCKFERAVTPRVNTPNGANKKAQSEGEVVRIDSRYAGGMQRIFTTFPNSWPGAGLLLIRLTLAIFLLTQLFPAGGAVVGVWLQATAIACAVALLLGLWTPIVCLFQFMMSIVLVVLGLATPLIWGPVSLLFLGLAMLGPGAWSVDAKLFGRKRMYIEPD